MTRLIQIELGFSNELYYSMKALRILHDMSQCLEVPYQLLRMKPLTWWSNFEPKEPADHMHWISVLKIQNIVIQMGFHLINNKKKRSDLFFLIQEFYYLIYCILILKDIIMSHSTQENKFFILFFLVSDSSFNIA